MTTRPRSPGVLRRAATAMVAGALALAGAVALRTAAPPPRGRWWDVYQPYSYNLNGRFGTAAEFASMVTACHAAGIWSNLTEIQNCELLGLPDLEPEDDDVRSGIAAYLNKQIALGVDGSTVTATFNEYASTTTG